MEEVFLVVRRDRDAGLLWMDLDTVSHTQAGATGCANAKDKRVAQEWRKRNPIVGIAHAVIAHVGGIDWSGSGRRQGQSHEEIREAIEVKRRRHRRDAA